MPEGMTVSLFRYGVGSQDEARSRSNCYLPLMRCFSCLLVALQTTYRNIGESLLEAVGMFPPLNCKDIVTFLGCERPTNSRKNTGDPQWYVGFGGVLAVTRETRSKIEVLSVLRTAHVFVG